MFSFRNLFSNKTKTPSRTYISAYTKEGYKKDIFCAERRQIYFHDDRIELGSQLQGHLGQTARIDPKKFPEMQYFEVTVEY